MGAQAAGECQALAVAQDFLHLRACVKSFFA